MFIWFFYILEGEIIKFKLYIKTNIIIEDGYKWKTCHSLYEKKKNNWLTSAIKWSNKVAINLDNLMATRKNLEGEI
jgi:signal peptidase I